MISENDLKFIKSKLLFHLLYWIPVHLVLSLEFEIMQAPKETYELGYLILVLSMLFLVFSGAILLITPLRYGFAGFKQLNEEKVEKRQVFFYYPLHVISFSIATLMMLPNLLGPSQLNGLLFSPLGKSITLFHLLYFVFALTHLFQGIKYIKEYKECFDTANN